MKRLLSPRDLADALGVSEATLTASASEGRLAIARTPGGHRRIAIAEAVRFIRASGSAVVHPESLGLSEVPTDDARHGEDELYALLYEGMGREARGLLLGRFLGGETIAALADGPLRGAMRRLGELWKHDGRGIFIEHRATDCAIQAVAALRSLVEPPDDGPLAVGGAPAGDPYLIPSLVAATVLAAEGIRPVNLGPDTPIASMRLAVVAHRPALAWLSCSVRLAEDVAPEVIALARDLRAEGIPLVTGGRNVAQVSLAPDVTELDSMAELAAFARRLVDTARRPAE